MFLFLQGNNATEATKNFCLIYGYVLQIKNANIGLLQIESDNFNITGGKCSRMSTKLMRSG